MLVELENCILVGTAHVSEKSVEEVREAIARYQPDIVAVELDENRFKALTDKKRFEETPVTELMKGGKAFFVLAQAMLASFQRRMGERYGVEPGAEMLAAIHEAKERGHELALADRDIGITLKRAWAKMGFLEKMKLSWEFMKALLGGNEEDEIVEVEEMLHEDVLTAMMEELARAAPSVSEVLVHERDAYLAARIDEARQRGTVLAVVGAGHMKGIVSYLRNERPIPDTKALEVIPEKKVKWGKIVGYSLVVALVGLIAWAGYQAFQSGDFSQLINLGILWIVVGGVLTMLGAALGGGHILSVLASFPAAPIGTLHPALAAGWISGFVEAKMRPPTYKDFETVGQLQGFRDFRRNAFMRILLVTAFANLGNMLANLVVMPYIILRLSGVA